MMASENIEKLVTLSRFEKGRNILPLMFYIPVGIALAVVRCFIFFHAVLMFYFLSKISFVHNILLRVIFAVCGLVIVADGDLQDDRHNLVLVANHLTSLDPFILSLVMHYILVVEPTSCAGDLTQLCSHVSISGDARKEDSVQFLRKTTQDSKLPLLLFPEGGRANSLFGLLKFRILPFQLDSAIQPIGIIARRWFFNINISTFSSPWWADLLLCFFVPFTLYNIKYLPLTEHRELESIEQFSERVQSNMAKGLGVAATDLTMSDIKDFVKDRERRKADASEPPLKPPSSSECYTPEAAAEHSEHTENIKQEENEPSSDPELTVMLKQVKEVLPYASSIEVLNDLELTRDVDATITNILEGRVGLHERQQHLHPSDAAKEIHTSTFKSPSFPRTAPERQMSLQERKQAMLEAARQRYKEKHGII